MQQFTLVIATVLALLASSVAACTCSHHKAEVKPEVPSCHQHAEMEMVDVGKSFSSDDDCFCVASGEQNVAKSEAVKLKKHIALTTVDSPVAVTVAEVSRTTTIGFAKPSFLSDSFYNLSPSRGPPRL